MTIGDILIQINQANLDTMLPLTAVKTSADIERYYKEDALDRVRFGMRAVDPKYFRNEMAHKLLPTAQSCVGQLKL